MFQGCIYIQECVPEIVDLKIKVWSGIDSIVDNDKTIMASSSSCIVPSIISEKLKHRQQFLVAHPVSINMNELYNNKRILSVIYSDYRFMGMTLLGKNFTLSYIG